MGKIFQSSRSTSSNFSKWWSNDEIHSPLRFHQSTLTTIDRGFEAQAERFSAIPKDPMLFDIAWDGLF